MPTDINSITLLTGTLTSLFAMSKQVRLFSSKTFLGWQDIYDSRNKHNGQVYLKILYKPYNADVAADEFSCPDSYFPLRYEISYIQ